MIAFISAASEVQELKIPLFTESYAAGFPSPAADYTESELDLNEYCIHRRHSTYFVRAIGNSMTNYAERAAEKLRGERQ